MTAAAERQFAAAPATRGAEPLLIGMVGPPGGGKTYSALRLGKGMQEVRGAEHPVVLIDTEGGRARKYADQFKFMHVNFESPHRPDMFLTAIKQQLQLAPACIIVDSMSDEHEGEGGYLEWHDEMVPKMGGNDWAAWAKPKAARKRLLTGLLHITVPLIFTFRAREKTKQSKAQSGRTEIINIGWMPVAPLEIVHSLDLTCILPPRADGVPVWSSEKIGEDFIVKLPSFLAPYIDKGATLTEETGRRLAIWAQGADADGVRKNPQRDGSIDSHVSNGASSAVASDGDLLTNARAAAQKGEKAFKGWYKTHTAAQKKLVNEIGDELRGLMAEADNKSVPGEGQ